MKKEEGNSKKTEVDKTQADVDRSVGLLVLWDVAQGSGK